MKARMLVAVAVTMISSLFVGMSAAPAQAYRGCHGKVQTRAESWANDEVWSHPSHRGLPETEKTRLSDTSVYIFCPNGRRPWKIKTFKSVYCYSHLTNMDGYDTFWFDGVVLDTRLSDDDTNIEPWARTVHDDGTWQNCRGFTYDRSIKKWLHGDKSPHRVTYGKIKRNDLPDPGWFRFHFLGDGWKYYHPDQAMHLSGWHR